MHQSFTITGLNDVMVVISPYTGKVTSYIEQRIPIDISLNLLPAISDDHAWEIAKIYYEQKGVKDILPSETTHKGLWIIRDDSGKQYLAWIFDVVHKGKLTMGGTIYIDAHDGHIINYGEIL
jgi:hypothetical protein